MRVGILGVAHIHAASYVSELKRAEISITGVYDRNSEKAERFCFEEGLRNLENPKAVFDSGCDTVLICSENVFHKELALQAASAKKHIIVEKPMALSAKDCEEMIAAAKENQVKLMVAHPVRFSQTIQDIKPVIEAKELGELLAINSSNHGKNPGEWFIQPDLSGGGALIDHTVHILDLVNYLFGLEVKEISAFISKTDETLAVEDTGLVLLSFEGEVIMSLDTSWNRPETYPIWGDAILELVFEKGYLVVDGFGRKMNLFDDQRQIVESFYYEENMDRLMMEAFIDAIDHDLSAPVSGEDGLYTVRITEGAFEAARLEKTIKI
ncbi:Gfo/Idh/MocA family oxidoreductase [Enterococcus sp. 669A]|uniref:Gfo/Idh/MocA family oxidoreductase n=1 Tax=Candidatus Enterococcus moelleringii TaxID=2815325 RepID=A0ABS3L549_9ENTE|nr:Gfo/Idh/MocA family oxidoreductase [Enterococcus sp. 669A]MBO1304738.1 Gfo/Idh/MocA family oxidoreductase [Enterococcus sp. 669A]